MEPNFEYVKKIIEKKYGVVSNAMIIASMTYCEWGIRKGVEEHVITNGFSQVLCKMIEGVCFKTEILIKDLPITEREKRDLRKFEGAGRFHSWEDGPVKINLYSLEHALRCRARIRFEDSSEKRVREMLKLEWAKIREFILR